MSHDGPVMQIQIFINFCHLWVCVKAGPISSIDAQDTCFEVLIIFVTRNEFIIQSHKEGLVIIMQVDVRSTLSNSNRTMDLLPSFESLTCIGANSSANWCGECEAIPGETLSLTEISLQISPHAILAWNQDGLPGEFPLDLLIAFPKFRPSSLEKRGGKVFCL